MIAFVSDDKPAHLFALCTSCLLVCQQSLLGSFSPNSSCQGSKSLRSLLDPPARTCDLLTPHLVSISDIGNNSGHVERSLTHLYNVETQVYFPHAFLSSKFQCMIHIINDNSEFVLAILGLKLRSVRLRLTCRGFGQMVFTALLVMKV